MAKSIIKNSRKIHAGPSTDPSLDNRVYYLENNEYKITYYEVVSGTSGSLTVPTAATINEGEFGSSGNAILSEIDINQKPTFKTPQTAGGVAVTANLNTTTGAWLASGVYTSSNVALIYSISILAKDYQNLNIDRIVQSEELDYDIASQAAVDTGTVNDQIVTPKTFFNSSKWATKENTVATGTTSQYWRGDKTFQTLDTSVVTENTNLYFTTARVLATALAGLNTGLTGLITSSDTILQAFGKLQYQISNIDLSAYQALSGKDASGGYVGLTLFKINFKNVANTFTSFFTNTNTASRTYTFQDRNGTIADDTDLATKLSKSNNLSDLANSQTAKVNLNIDKRTTVGDANYTILTTDKEVVTSAALTANRTYTLPTGETAGQEFIVADEFQALGTYTITIAVATGKKLNGVLNGTVTMVTAGGHRRFFGDGSGNYTYDAGIARLGVSQTFTGINTFATTPVLSSLTASQILATDASKNVQSLDTTTYPSLTELSYTKGVTSAIQTQLDAKLSSTKERLLTICGFAGTNPADATSYYFSEYTDAVPQTSQGIYKFQFNENLTVTRVVITVKHVTNPTNESVSFYLRASSTTDQTITTSMNMNTVGASTSKVFVYSGLNLSVTSGTDYEIKMTTPTWATNPTNTTIRIKIYGY